jgi:hypothetical protein
MEKPLSQIRTGCVALAAATCLFGAPAAQATLVTGTDITVNGVPCSVGSSCNNMSGAGYSNLQVGPSWISFDAWVSGIFNVDFGDFDWVQDPVLTFTGIFTTDPSVLNPTANSFTISYENYVPQGETIGIDLYSKVPEPATLALIALGAAGLALGRRRKS